MPIVNVMKEKEMQNAYIGEYVVETYTVSKFWNNTSWATQTKSIYKSWYKVAKIEIDTYISAWSSTIYWQIDIEARRSGDTSTNCSVSIPLNWSIPWRWVSCYININSTPIYSWPSSNPFWFTPVHFEISLDVIKLSNEQKTIDVNYNLTSSEKTSIETLFSSSDIEILLRAIYPYLWPTTITVSYEKA